MYKQADKSLEIYVVLLGLVKFLEFRVCGKYV